MNRRAFLAAAATTSLSGFAMADEAGKQQEKPADKSVAALDKINVALIGCGGMGNGRLAGFSRIPDFEIVALADCDDRQIGNAMRVLEQAKRPTSSVRTYEDYRKMIDQMKDLDAVIIGTPDHHHAYALIAAAMCGKGGKGLHVFCEKPLSHSIVEGRKMVEAIARQRLVCQIGTQQRSGRHFQNAVSYVQSGKLGHVYLCRTFITNRTEPAGSGNPPDLASPPAGVNYDLWLGPAPQRRFNAARFHGNFRWFADYGNGLCNDWGVHLNDIILWGMRVKAPLAVTAAGGKYEMQDDSDTPDTLDVTYEYPGFVHHYCVRRGRLHGGFGGRSHGMEFVGTKGTLFVDRGGWTVTPAEGSDLPPEKHGGSDQDQTHIKNFLACIRDSSLTPNSAIEDMHRATTTCHLANISYRTGRRIVWDAENERCYRGWDSVANQFVHEDAEANAWLYREPRAGWKLSS